MTHVAVPSSAVRRRAIAAANIGSFVEFFDFGVYGSFATVLASQFFPGQDPFAALLATFAVFTVSFVFRPVGALVFGHFGDRLGRTRVLSLVIIMMSGATFLMGLVPTHASIGILAPLALVLLRAVQGLSTGGEWGGSASMIVEYSPNDRRGFLCGLNLVSVLSGSLVGLLMGAVLSLTLEPAALNSWGWRIPFLLALPIGAVGFYLRLRLDETPAFRAVQAELSVEKAPLLTLGRRHGRAVTASLGITVFTTVSTLMLVFMASYLPLVRHLDFLRTTVAVSVGFIVDIAVVLVASRLSDRIGRRRVMIAGAVFGVIALYPVFRLVQGAYPLVLLGVALLGAVHGLFAGPFPAAQAELFPTRVRYSGLSLTYGVASAVFGGLTPLLLTLLLQRTGDPFAPAFYGAAAAAVSGLVVVLMPEPSALRLDDAHGAGLAGSPSAGRDVTPGPSAS